MEKLRIYLAGYTLENEYRETVHNDYEVYFDIVDPIMLISPERDDEIPSVDKFLITTCQILVAYIVRPSWGTAMEIVFAYDRNKLVFIIDPTEQIRKDKWVRFHCHRFFNSIEECFETLMVRNIDFWLGGKNV